MSALVKREESGDCLLQTNPFFKDLCSLMRNKEFKRFYDEHFHSWNDIECIVFYMKLYTTIEYEYEKRFETKITDSLMTYTLHEIMSNLETRRAAMALFKNYESDITINQSQPLRSLLKFAEPYASR